MSVKGIIGRLVHHTPKLTDEQKRQKVLERRAQLRESGFWVGTG